MDNQQKNRIPEVVTNVKSVLGEGPVWDARNQRIIWVDIVAGKIHSFGVHDNRYQSIEVGCMIGSLGLKESGGYIAALQKGFATIDDSGDEIKLFANPETHIIGNRFNDGKCDPAGRFWAGTMPLTGEALSGSLYMVDKDYSITSKIDRVGCSNGLAWSLDNKTLYFIDTVRRTVAAYDYDIETGAIFNGKEIIRIPEDEGYPDGMTIDSEGMLWIAIWEGWKVTRWNPHTGVLLDTIMFPVSKVTSCTFGGESLEDLYVTSAKIDLNENELENQPMAGSLFVIKKCGYKGLKAVSFRESAKTL